MVRDHTIFDVLSQYDQFIDPFLYTNLPLQVICFKDVSTTMLHYNRHHGFLRTFSFSLKPLAIVALRRCLTHELWIPQSRGSCCFERHPVTAGYHSMGRQCLSPQATVLHPVFKNIIAIFCLSAISNFNSPFFRWSISNFSSHLPLLLDVRYVCITIFFAFVGLPMPKNI